MYIGIKLDNKKHCTLTFHGHKETKRQYKKAIKAVKLAVEWWHETNRPPLLAQLTGNVGYFGSKDKGVWATIVEGEDLHEFREYLVEALEVVGCSYVNDYPEFKPHVTMTRWKQPKKGLTGTMAVDKITIVSDTHGVEEVEV